MNKLLYIVAIAGVIATATTSQKILAVAMGAACVAWFALDIAEKKLLNK